MTTSLKDARISAELTQEDAGKLIGVTANTISRWERGITAPAFQYLRPICDAYGISDYDDISFLPKKSQPLFIFSE